MVSFQKQAAGGGVLLSVAALLLFLRLVVFAPRGLYVPDFSTVDRVEYHDLAEYDGSGEGWNNDERVLFLVPLRDASAHLGMFFDHMANMTYPKHLIDLAFLISDTSDDTVAQLSKHLMQVRHEYGSMEIFYKNFNQVVSQSFSDRHSYKAQGPRRMLMGRARNWLLSSALKPYHSHVHWRDVDVETVPATILEDLMSHDKDVIVPNVWRPLPSFLGSMQPYDLNSWQESDGGLQLAESLDDDTVIVEGYVELQTWRPHLAYLRDPYGDAHVEMELDGIGGVSILSKAKVFRGGAHFPGFPFMNHAETEAYGKMCRRMGYSVVGLPHYVIWHIYEPSNDDLKHMEWMAQEEVRQKEEAKIKKVYDRVWDKAFNDVSDVWRVERAKFLKNTDMSNIRKVHVDWSGVDEWEIEAAKEEGKKLADFKP
ncbi:mannan polymerase II complex Anp1p subunit [Diutina catenulata]